MLSISLEAFVLDEEVSVNLQRQADALNGCIVSECDRFCASLEVSIRSKSNDSSTKKNERRFDGSENV